MPNLGTKYKRSKNVLADTSIALSCAHICARLLQPLAKSLIGSPGTLFAAVIRMGGMEGTGTPYRDCARGCINRGQSRPMMSAIDVTAKTFFERLYLFLL